MRTRKWVSTVGLFTVAAVFAGLTMPAMGRPKPSYPDTVAVTLEYQGAGLATTASCGNGPLIMSQEPDGMLRADWNDPSVDVVDLEMYLPIPWERNHPESSGATLDGCHGSGTSVGGVGGTEGFFVLEPQLDGSLLVASRFDYYWEYDEAQRGKQTRHVQTVLEFFEIDAYLSRIDGLAFDTSPSGDPQIVTGILELRWFEKLGKWGGWTSLGSTDIEIKITINET